MEHFSDTAVHYLVFLLVILNTNIVQRIVDLLQDRVPVIRDVLSSKQILRNIRSRIFRTSWRSQDKFC